MPEPSFEILTYTAALKWHIAQQMRVLMLRITSDAPKKNAASGLTVYERSFTESNSA